MAGVVNSVLKRDFEGLLPDAKAGSPAMATPAPIGCRALCASQFDINANQAGDRSQWFDLPGGPVAFALGTEYYQAKAC